MVYKLYALFSGEQADAAAAISQETNNYNQDPNTSLIDLI
jgi:hypothetical protein